MRIEHIAVWTHDLERLRTFYERYFGAQSGQLYRSRTRHDFTSYFLRFPDGGARLELMSTAGLGPSHRADVGGYAHLAVSVGSEAAVDALAARLVADGVPLLSGPRRTGDGYYEAVVADPDGNSVEVTV
jgi:lactoylglutathione lyase